MSDRVTIGCEAEYSALRDEVLKRVALRYQILRLAVITTGVILALGLRDDVSTKVLLLYPILALFLATDWIHNGTAINKIGTYIRNELEPYLHMRWETVLQESDPPYFGKFDVISAAGLFLVTQGLSVGLALCEDKFVREESLLIAVSIFAILVTAVLLYKYTWSAQYNWSKNKKS